MVGSRARLIFMLIFAAAVVSAVASYAVVRVHRSSGDNEAAVELREIALNIDTLFFGRLSKAASELASLPSVVAALSSPDISPAESLTSIQAARAALNASVIYLLDPTGMTILTTNFDQPDSFQGKNFGFRPYFTEAMIGRNTIYDAVGITSGVRGFYFGAPIKNDRDQV